jgi:hypothetical protein
VRVGGQGHPSECRGAMVSDLGAVTSKYWVSIQHGDVQHGALLTTCAVCCRYIRTDLAEQVQTGCNPLPPLVSCCSRAVGRIQCQCAYVRCTQISSSMPEKADNSFAIL